MTIEIVPTVLTEDFEEAKRRVKLVEPFVRWVQLDVIGPSISFGAGGALVKTWNEPKRVKDIETSASLEADLMLQNPSDEVLDAWLHSGAKRVFIAFEGVDDVERLSSIIKRGKAAGVEMGISIAPDTPTSVLEPFGGDLDAVMIRTAVPGAPGRPFEPRTLEKIREFHVLHSEIPIAVDGGVSAQTVGEIAKAGATLIGVGTYIFNHPQGVEEAIKELKRVA